MIKHSMWIWWGCVWGRLKTKLEKMFPVGCPTDDLAITSQRRQQRNGASRNILYSLCLVLEKVATPGKYYVLTMSVGIARLRVCKVFKIMMFSCIHFFRYDEVCKHNFANKDFQKPSGHFINIVWKPTEELGIAMAHGTKWGMNCTWVVARYRPRVQYRPEVENSFGLNVEKGTFDPAYCNANGEEQQEKGNERSWRNRVNWGRPYAGYGFRTKIPRTPRVMVA